MASGEGDRGFRPWLNWRLEVLGVAWAMCGAYIWGILQEDNGKERLGAPQGILAAFLEEDSFLGICREIVKWWLETKNVVTKEEKEDEVQDIATLVEKQVQIVVKSKMVSEEEKQWKTILLAQYANVMDEEDEADEKDDSVAMTMNIRSEKCILLWCISPKCFFSIS